MRSDLHTTMPCKNIGINDKFCRKVALLRYTERLKFRSQSLNSASKQNHIEDWPLGCHPGDNKSFYKYSKVVLRHGDGLLNWLFSTCGVRYDAVFRSYSNNF